MSKMSFHFTVATSAKAVVDTDNAIQAVDQYIAQESNEGLSVTDKVFIGLVKEAFTKGGYEAAIKELLRYTLRLGINDGLSVISGESNKSLAVTFAPVAVRFAEVK